MTLNVGVIGFVPPLTLEWDSRTLAGKVKIDGPVEPANRWIPEMRRGGADVVVALSHGGIDASPYTPTMENTSFHMARVPGVDVLVAGHTHQIFPRGKEINAPALAPVLAALPASAVDGVSGFVHGRAYGYAAKLGPQAGYCATESGLPIRPMAGAKRQNHG